MVPLAPARPCGEAGGGVGDTLRDPEALEAVSRLWGPHGGRNLEIKSEGPRAREVARDRAPGTLGSRLRPRPHSGPEEREDPAPARPGAFPEGWAKQKVEEKWETNPGVLFLLTWRRRARMGPGPSPRAAARGTAAVSTESGPGPAPSTVPPRAATAPPSRSRGYSLARAPPGPAAGRKQQLEPEGRR